MNIVHFLQFLTCKKPTFFAKIAFNLHLFACKKTCFTPKTFIFYNFLHVKNPYFSPELFTFYIFYIQIFNIFKIIFALHPFQVWNKCFEVRSFPFHKFHPVRITEYKKFWVCQKIVFFSKTVSILQLFTCKKTLFFAKIIYILHFFTCKKLLFFAKIVYILHFFTCKKSLFFALRVIFYIFISFPPPLPRSNLDLADLDGVILAK